MKVVKEPNGQYTATVLKPWLVGDHAVTFTPNGPSDDELCSDMVTMSRKTYDWLGQPDMITVTIEPGAALEDVIERSNA